MITTISLVTICHHANFIVEYNVPTVHFVPISVTHLFCNCKFVPLNPPQQLLFSTYSPFVWQTHVLCIFDCVYALLSEKAMAPHFSALAWKIPWMEEPGGLQSMGSLRVRHNWATSLSLFTFMHWRRKWQATPVFLPGESQGQGSLVGCHLWGLRVGHDWSNLAVAAGTLGKKGWKEVSRRCLLYASEPIL